MVDLLGGSPTISLASLVDSDPTVQFLDTTLRDGEQAPGISLSPEEKAEIAIALDRAGVDFIEYEIEITDGGGNELYRTRHSVAKETGTVGFEPTTVGLEVRRSILAELCALTRT